MQKELKIIGRIEQIDFPEFEIKGLNAKIDTGAYTSSLHCRSIRVLGDQVAFVPLEPEDKQYTGTEIFLPLIKETQVKSSSGHVEERCVVKTKVILFEKEFDIFLTLTDRSDMKYPVLLGRKFLAGKFLVDVRLKHQS